MESHWSKKSDSAMNEVASINRTIDSIGVERGKSHNVLDARKEAEDIIEAAISQYIDDFLYSRKLYNNKE